MCKLCQWEGGVMAYALGGEAAWYQPPDPGPECLWCDGGGNVSVASIQDVLGKVHVIDFVDEHNVEVQCPRCDGTGVEPVGEREDR